MKSILQEYGRPVMGISARYNCAYSTLDRPLWWNVDTSGGQCVCSEGGLKMCYCFIITLE